MQKHDDGSGGGGEGETDKRCLRFSVYTIAAHLDLFLFGIKFKKKKRQNRASVRLYVCDKAQKIKNKNGREQ